MKKRHLTFRAVVKMDGQKPKLEILDVPRDQVARLIFEMFGEVNNGRVLLTVTESQTSGNNAPTLAWFHGVFLPFTAKEMRTQTGDREWDEERLKQTLKENYLPLDGDGLLPSLADLSDSELKEFINNAKDFAAEWVGVEFDRPSQSFPTQYQQ